MPDLTAVTEPGPPLTKQDQTLRDTLAALIYQTAHPHWAPSRDDSPNSASYAATDALLSSEVFAALVDARAEALRDLEQTPCTCGYGGFHEEMNTRCERTQAAARLPGAVPGTGSRT